jgi:hypothetical protein
MPFEGVSFLVSLLFQYCNLLTRVAWVWLTIHLPFAMAFTLSAATLSKIVLAHDTRESNPEDLTETYAARSEKEVSVGLWWFYCGGLSIALACMGIISLSHSTKIIPGQRLSKMYRTIYRLAVALAILLLPLAHDRLTSLDLVAITASLVVSVLVVDLAGLSCQGDSFINSYRNCDYSANCKVSRKELAEKMKNGETVNVEDLARTGGFKGEENHDLIV